MYLKQLDIKGFKSFADKIELEFGNGITAIVGPNGSGKSNIADAVRWVLGEQSAKTLRGGKMEDVIFAGTENRKALGCSEVSLTIDNGDKILPIEFSEVTVTRRLFRSGESEYLVNNIPYRLKDISELFMDTGIGKDGYSLIGQGKIDEILSTKSEDRRNLFEEAAGIVKYRSRKQEAEKKLENTEQNIIRITDIIRELEEQIEPLGLQSEAAKKFLALREELKELEVNVILYNYDNGKNKLDKLSKDIEELLENEQSTNIKKNEVQEICQRLKEELEKIDEEYREAVNIRLDTEKSYENKQGNLQLINEKYDNHIREIDRIEKEIRDEKNLVIEIDKKNVEISINKNKIETDIEDQKKLLEKIYLEYEQINEKCSSYEVSIDNKKNDLIELLKENSDLHNKTNSSQINIQNIENRKKQINKETDIKNQRLETVNNDIAAYQNKVSALLNKSETEKAEIKILNDEIKYLEEQYEQLKQSRNRIYDRLKGYEAKYSALNAMEHDMEGFNRAVKAVISNYKDGNKIFGTVSELIGVPKGFEVAVEIALSSGIQNIIVDNEDTAGRMIDYLKKNNLGRATFLPLTTIKGRSVNFVNNSLLTDIKGFRGVASDIVNYDIKYKSAITNLLGRILICDDLSSAKIIAGRTDYNYKIVTMDGDIVNAGGSFTGGSTNLRNIGILSRKNEIHELKEVIDREAESFNEIEAQIKENLHSFNTKKEMTNEKNLCLQETTIDYNNEISKINAVNKERINIEENISELKIELEQLQGEYEKNADFINKNKANIDILEEKQRTLEENVNKMQAEYREFISSKEDCWNRITSEKVIQAENNKTLESFLENLKQLASERNNHLLKISSNEALILENNEKIAADKDLIEKNTEEIKEISEKIIFIRHRISDIENRRQETNAKIGVFEKDIQKIDETLNELTLSIHKLEISKSKIETETEAIINKLWDEYELTIPDALKYRREIKSITESNRKLNELKTSIRELGDVNVNSIEEYKRVKDRYEFLNLQISDLTKAQESLLGVIEEMTAKMTQKFIEKFKIIKENFNHTFKELFGGGIADLKLEGEDVLNSGIEIIVQPPGKKLQALTLLSGGERGLAAIALLFAILKMKPTPFCVLDEIEAALDDANVNRYAQFLKKYSKNTQFITITHRKGSMAAADALYGVTMEEKGVSKMISLKLNGGK